VAKDSEPRLAVGESARALTTGRTRSFLSSESQSQADSRTQTTGLDSDLSVIIDG